MLEVVISMMVKFRMTRWLWLLTNIVAGDEREGLQVGDGGEGAGQEGRGVEGGQQPGHLGVEGLWLAGGLVNSAY